MAPVLFQLKSGIAHLTLNRQDKYNAFNREMALLLQQHLDHCANDAQVRCVYITGAGKAFSAARRHRSACARMPSK